MIEVSLPSGDSYTVKELLADGDSNAKLTKSNLAGKGFLTFGLSLAPANLSGYEVCASRSKGCTMACLNTSGLGNMQSVQDARIAKTIAFFEHRSEFIALLYKNLSSAKKKADKQGKRIAVRLNVVSDIMWEKVVPTLFTDFKDVQFYDYTKHRVRMLHSLQSNYQKFPSNYHLTFSRSEENEISCLEILRAGGNVTVVFSEKDLPKRWHGYKVINGDETDLRFLDSKRSVVGLYAKGKAKKDTSGFVVSLPVLKV
jgi:hypothetical protein